MRRLIVLAAALGLMLSMIALRTDSPSGTADPLTLAAIGFVVLAAFTVGELMTLIKLPKITGYIVCGLLLGPQVFDILSGSVVADLSVFNTLALGLIATTAGLELDLAAIRKVARSLFATVGLKVPLLLLFVGGVFCGAELAFGVLALPSTAHVLAMGLVLAVLGIGTSPAIALAIINESGAKGRLSDLTLAIAVVKDIVVVIALALAVAIARSLLDPSSTLGADVVVHVAVEIGESLLVGAILGGLLIAYMRFVHAEMLLVVVVTVLGAAELASVLRLELLLVFITAGFVVRNFSHYEHELLEPLLKVSLPVFVVFFTTAGAGIDLRGTVKLLPIAGAVVLGRMLAYSIAGRYGARFGGETKRVADNAWMAYMPQAGVTLGLVLLASAALPPLAEPIRATGMAVVTLNLLIGPVLLGLAIKRAGETPAERAALEQALEPIAAATTGAEAIVTGVGPEVPAEGRRELAEEPELRVVVERLELALHAELDRFTEDVIEPMIERADRTTARLFYDAERKTSPAQAVHAALAGAPIAIDEGWEGAVQDLDERLERWVQSMPERAVVRVRPELLGLARGDAPWTLAAKLLGRLQAALTGGRSPRRVVPVQLAARVALDAPLAEAAAAVHASWHRTQLAMLDDVRRLVLGQLGTEACREAVRARAEAWPKEARETFDAAIGGALEALSERLARLGGPGHPAARLRLSDAEPRKRAARRQLVEHAPRWRRATIAMRGTLRAAAGVHTAHEAFLDVLRRRAWRPLAVVEEELLALPLATAEGIEALGVGADEPIGEAAPRLAELVKARFTRKERNRFRGLTSKYRHAAQSSELLNELSEIVETLPESIELTRVAVPDIPLDPREIDVESVALRRRVAAVLIDRFVPRFNEAIRGVTETVAGADDRLEEIIDAAAFGLESLAQKDVAEERRVSPAELLDRAEKRLREFVDEGRAATGLARTEIEEARDHAEAGLNDVVSGRAGARDLVRSGAQQTGRAALRVLERTGDGARHLGRWLLRAVRGSDPQHAWPDDPEHESIDPARMARLLRESLPPPDALPLPALCRKVFSVEAVEDPRLAIAYRPQLDDLLRFLQPGKGQDFTNVLVVGDHGSGRTSVVNLVELRLARYRVLRLDPRFHGRTDGLLRAVAAEIGCLPDVGAITEALRARTSVVLIDDLEHYVGPTPDGVEALDRFLEVVVRTRAFTHWVASAQSDALRLLDELSPVSNAFGRRLELRPLDGPALREVIESRARLAGMALRLPERRLFGRAIQWGAAARVQGYYEALARVSSGNLRGALLAHLRALELVADTPSIVRAPRRHGLAFLGALEPDALAALATLLRFGPMREPELAPLIACTESRAAAVVLPLEDASLVERSPRDRAVRVPAHLEHEVAEALRGLGVLAPAWRQP